MSILDECHEKGFLFKAFGGCNQAKREVNKCLRAERLLRSRANREKSRAKREEIEAEWAVIDANSAKAE
jgi:COX assembly mitochondrial protein 2